MKKGREKKSVLEDVLDRAVYKTGFICAKAIKLKDGISWKDISKDTKDVLAETQDRARGLVEGMKKSASNMAEFFKKGFESSKEESAAPVTVKAVSAGGKKGSRPEAKEKAKGPIKKSKSKEAGRKQTGQKTKEIPKEILNKDFEREIEKIDKEVAEV